MVYQSSFKRYEIKYILTPQQKSRVLETMASYMEPDSYGKTTIRNIYYDTENYRLIRNSLDRPVYKEKLRLRSYRRTEEDEAVFVELKKKYKGVVYKRRLDMPQRAAVNWLAGNGSGPDTQIGREILYFRDFYETLCPVVFLSYERQAWFCRTDSELRITFDENILCRQDDLTLAVEPSGLPVLEPELTLMEIKTSGGMPLWLTELLCREKIYKVSFSKYGTAYKKLIYPKTKGENAYA